MKRIIAISALLFSNIALATNWEFLAEHENGVNQYSASNFDNVFENGITLNCDSKNKDIIISILASTPLTSKKISIISFNFKEIKEKIKFKSSYSKDFAWTSKILYKTKKIKNNGEFSKLIKKLKGNSLVTVGVVKNNGQSHYFDISLKGSSYAINSLSKFCVF